MLARWLLLAAIAAILGAVGITYRIQRHEVETAAPPKPAPLPESVSGKADDWHWTHSVQGRPVVEIRARNLKQDRATSRMELEGVKLRLFHKDGAEFDRVESAHAIFQPSEEKLYSDADVLITLGVPIDGEPKRQLVSISTSGVTFETKTGRASTDRPAGFTFENGTGKSVGATYDPSLRELHLRGGVELNWRASGARSKAMKMESGELIYREQSSVILLRPWARLFRGTSTIEGADTIVALKEGAIDQVQTQKAKGMDRSPERQLEYAADRLMVHFEEGEPRKVTGESNARLVSTSQHASTTVTTDRIDLEFEPGTDDTVLRSAMAHGHGVVEARPLPSAPQPPPDTRILRAEVIEMKMRPGGKDMELLATHSPGRLEFVPNRPGGRRRQMDGERLWVTYGVANRIQSFRSVEVETRTDAASAGGAPTRTWSKNLLAHFDPQSGEMSKLEQWENFRYEEGARKAVASRAELESKTNRITLDTGARVWDPTGSTSADKIELNQTNGDYTAQGRVNSSRKPDKKSSSPGMLSGDEPVQAVAARMTSTQRNAQIRYEGDAVLWQGPNRIKADTIEIDRESRRLVGSGKVETQLLEKAGDQKPGARRPVPVLTTVRSGALVYTEADRLAHYTGGVTLIRPRMRVKSSELRAVLAESGSDSSLEKAYADGKVEIVQSAPDRTRTGTSEHAEYFVDEEKVILRGGQPLLADSRTGNTRGAELTYFAGDDKLLVNGEPDRPATSRLRRK